MIKIAHIINPVAVKESSDLFVAQPVTFSTMRHSQSFARDQGLDVQLFSTCYPEDLSVSPEGFGKTPNLENSVLDYGDFQVARKLPILRDILDRLNETARADYLIYTNVDISVLPNFYLSVAGLINKGYDAFVINRRTISSQFSNTEDIPLMCSEVGQKHKGHDCFVFRRDAYNHYSLGSSCIGASLVGKILLTNLICNANKFEEFKDFHLTFHIGNDRVWDANKLQDYSLHNLKEFQKVVKDYQEAGRLKDHPLISKSLRNIDNIDYWLGGKSPQSRKIRGIDKIRQVLQRFK